MSYQSSGVPCHEELSTVAEWWALPFHTVVLPPAGGRYLLPWPLGNTLINPVPSIVLSSMFFPPRAQMAKFRVGCLGESGVTALVKEPEAELIIVIKASYLHNTSQAEGTQSSFPGPCRRSCPAPTLPCCCFPGDLEQRLGSSICPCQSGPPQMQGGRKHCWLRQASARPPENLESDFFQVPTNPWSEATHYHGI